MSVEGCMHDPRRTYSSTLIHLLLLILPVARVRLRGTSCNPTSWCPCGYSCTADITPFTPRSQLCRRCRRWGCGRMPGRPASSCWPHSPPPARLWRPSAPTWWPSTAWRSSRGSPFPARTPPALDQSDAVSVGIFAWQTNQLQEEEAP
eukprot:1181293-Prorocentrum_minimum.AAC.5